MTPTTAATSTAPPPISDRDARAVEHGREQVAALVVGAEQEARVALRR